MYRCTIVCIHWKHSGVSLCVCVPLHPHGDQGKMSVAWSITVYLVTLRLGLSLDLGIPGSQPAPAIFLSVSTGMEAQACLEPCLASYMCVGNLNSGPYACTISILLQRAKFPVPTSNFGAMLTELGKFYVNFFVGMQDFIPPQCITHSIACSIKTFTEFSTVATPCSNYTSKERVVVAISFCFNHFDGCRSYNLFILILTSVTINGAEQLCTLICICIILRKYLFIF